MQKSKEINRHQKISEAKRREICRRNNEIYLYFFFRPTALVVDEVAVIRGCIPVFL